MRLRTLSAIIAVGIFLPFVIAGQHWFALAIAFIGLVSLFELARMASLTNHWFIVTLSVIGLLAMMIPTRYLPFFATKTSANAILNFVIMGLMIATVFLYREFSFRDAGILVLGIMYIGTGYHNLINIRDLGFETIAYLFLVIWSTDIGAYFIGRRFGKRKLAPHISPNKTVEGAIGGSLFSLVVTGIFSSIFQPNFGDTRFIWLLTLFISFAGQFGDLVESTYKRYFGVKDSGKIIPGHGGMLDRFDSMLFASWMVMIWMNFFS